MAETPGSDRAQIEQRAEKYLAWERGLTGLKPPLETTALVRDLLSALAAAEARAQEAEQQRDEWKAVVVPKGGCFTAAWAKEFLDYGMKHMTAELAAERALEKIVQYVVASFKADEAQGYRSKDRQFAIELFEKFIPALPAGVTAQTIEELRAALSTPPASPQVGCERHDGLLNVHREDATCEVCAPASSPAPFAAELQKALSHYLGYCEMVASERARGEVIHPSEAWWSEIAETLREARAALGDLPRAEPPPDANNTAEILTDRQTLKPLAALPVTRPPDVSDDDHQDAGSPGSTATKG